QAAGLAWWYGLGQFGFGAYWIFVSIHTFGKVILPLALLLTCAFILFMALFPALLGWLWARGRPRIAHPVGAMGLFVALWVLLEWVRGWFLTGFPWLLLGYSQIDTPLAGWGKLLGVYGISLAVMLSMAVLASWRDTALRGRVFGLGLLVGLWGGGLLLQHWGWTEVRGR
ncbi:MAG: apolipoprotein N-acyltransferase, partial [Anaerolineae bacterium]|nr:apolipoprotein N-acyltransferase [Anaerolineae bacterium]